MSGSRNKWNWDKAKAQDRVRDYHPTFTCEACDQEFPLRAKSTRIFLRAVCKKCADNLQE